MRKRKSCENAFKYKCRLVTQHIALIEIPVALFTFVEFLLTNLNNLFATIPLDRSN